MADNFVDRAGSVVLMRCLKAHCGNVEVSVIRCWERNGICVSHALYSASSGSYQSWKERYFVLRGLNLSYYSTKPDVRHHIMHHVQLFCVHVVSHSMWGCVCCHQGTIKLKGVMEMRPDSAIEVAEDTGKPFSWTIEARKRTFYLHANSEETRKQWMEVLEAAKVTSFFCSFQSFCLPLNLSPGTISRASASRQLQR